MRALFTDRRMWTSIGIVVQPDDAADHYEEVEGPADVLVEVMLQPALIPVTCRLAAGVWLVPDVGEEVAVLIPEGQPSFMPIIIANLSSNSLPTDQGPAPGRIAIVRGEVVIHDGAGGAEALTKHSDLEALAEAFNDWTPAPNDGGAALKALLTTLLGTGWPFGTTVLKGK